jgi:phosphoribosylanthranilate isomerase
LCLELGVHRLGFVLAPSPRQVSLQRLDQLLARLPAGQAWVAVTVDASLELLEALLDRGCPFLQFHGREDPSTWVPFQGRAGLMQALRLSAPESLQRGSKFADELLLDGPGQGRTFPWEWLDEFRPRQPFWLAGGLTPENLPEAVARVRPFGVDVSSGVESQPGQKDPFKLRRWMEIVKSCR